MSTRRRPKGEGSITQLPNGRIKLTLTLGKDLNGKQRRKSFTGKTRAEVLQKAAAIRIAVAKGVPQDTPPTFQEVYEQFSGEWFHDKAESTYNEYRSMIRHFKDNLYPLRIDKITPEYLTSLFMPLFDIPLKNSTIIQFKRLLSVVFNYAKDKGLFHGDNPCHKLLLGLRVTNKVDLTIITPEQLKELLSQLKAFDNRECTWGGAKLYPIFLLGAVTGMRRGELLGLRKAAVDMKTSVIDIRAQVQDYRADLPLKTKSSYRHIHVDKKILSYIMKVADTESEFVFSGIKTHTFINQPSFRSYMAAFFKVYPKPYEGFSFHALRHYHATQLLANGLDVKSISRRLGHGTIQTTLDRYAHWIPEVDKKAAQIIGRNLL